MFRIQSLKQNTGLGILPFAPALDIIGKGLSFFTSIFGHSERSDEQERSIRAQLAEQSINAYGLSGDKLLDPDILRSMIDSRSPNFTIDIAEYLDQVSRFKNNQYPLLRSINDSRQSFHDYTTQIETRSNFLKNEFTGGSGGEIGSGKSGINFAGFDTTTILILAGAAFALFAGKSKGKRK